MLADGDVLVTDADPGGQTALLYAAQGESLSLPTLKWLLEKAVLASQKGTAEATWLF
jgi:hypothetical protein